MGNDGPKILLIAHGLPPELVGGTERYVLRTARQLRDRGASVEILFGSMVAGAMPELESEEREGIPVHRVLRQGLFLDRWDKSFCPDTEAFLRRRLEAFRPDVVHVHHWIRLTRTLVETCHAAGIPTVVTLHDLWSSCPRCFRVRDGGFCERPLSVSSCLDCVPRDAFQTDLEVAGEIELFRDDHRQELDLAAAVIVPSRSHGETCARFLERDPDEFVVVPHGSDPDELPARSAPPPEEGPIHVAFWSHLQPIKGIDLLIDAAASLPEALRERLVLEVFGRATDDEFRQGLVKRAAGLEVRWHGAYVPRDLSGHVMHWAVIPSRARESYSFVLDEAFALGVPVIVPRHGALHERLGRAGISFAAEDEASLRMALQRVLEQPDLRRACRAAMPPPPAADEHLRRLEEIYARVRNRGSSKRPDPELAERRRRQRSLVLEERYREVLEARGEVGHLRAEGAHLESVLEETRRSTREHEAAVARTEAELERVHHARDEATLALEDYGRAVALVAAERDEARGRSEHLAQRESDLTEQVEDLRRRVEELERHARALEEHREALDTSLREHVKALRQRDTIVEQFKVSLDNHRELQESTEARRQELEHAREELTASCAALGEKIAGLEDDRETLQASLAEEQARVAREARRLAERAGRNGGGLDVAVDGILGELERVSAERSTALERLADVTGRETERRRHWWYRLASRFAEGRGGRGAESRLEGRRGPRILMVIHDFLPGHPAGSEIYTYNLAKALSVDHDVHLLFTEAHFGVHQYTVREGVFDGLPFTEVCHQHATRNFERTYLDPRMRAIFEDVLRRIRPDLVHVQNLHWFSLDCVSAAKRRGIPVVYTLHEYLLLCPHGGRMRRDDGEVCAVPIPEKCADCITGFELGKPKGIEGQASLLRRLARPVPRPLRRLARGLLGGSAEASGAKPAEKSAYVGAIARRLEVVRNVARDVDLFISPSRFLRERFIAAGVAAPDQIIFSDNGQDLAPFEAVERRPSTELRIGFIGTVSEYKGLHVLIDAMNRLVHREDFSCHVHGAVDTFPEYGAELRSRVENPRVHFHGGYRREEVGRVLAGIDVLVVPSLWYENSPLTIHEAFIAGLPVIASDLGGMKEFVEDGKNGFLFAPGDDEDLARVLSKFEDRGLLEELRNHHVPIKSIAEDARAMAARYQELLVASRAEAPA